MKTPRTVADWSGLGTLYQDDDPCAQIEYRLRVWHQEETAQTGGEDSGLYASSGSFKSIGFEPEIQNGAKLFLQLEDGRRVEVLVASYEWGQGTLRLTNKALQDLFGAS